MNKQKEIPEKCPDCGASIFSIDEKEWRCEDQRSCGWSKILPLKNIEKISKEIFKDSLVCVKTVNDPEIRHIYLCQNLTGEQIKELESKFKILFVSSAYDEDEKEIGHKLTQIILVSAHDSKFDIQQALKNLVKDIREIPDGDVDRYLIIDEIKKIIKEYSS